ncbi:MAG: MBL fold metallo-hydrolase, partial [Eubacteriales bacterium]
MQTKKELVIDASVRGRNNNSPNRHYSQAKNANQKKASSENETSSLKIAFLGGLNEVGKNMTLYEYGGDMMLVDCGMAFPDQDMLGVDIVLPDFTFVERNADKIRGIIVTHGHEDHIGGLPYLLKVLNMPIYGTRLTIGLI